MKNKHKWLLKSTLLLLLLASCSGTGNSIATPTIETSAAITIKQSQETVSGVQNHLVTIQPNSTITPWPLRNIPTYTPIPSASYFILNGKPFRFVGAFVPGWFWNKNQGDDLISTTEDLIVSAKASGISVLHVMLPGEECQPDTCLEENLEKLDLLIDLASKRGVYIILPFLHGNQLSFNSANAFYNQWGTQGLIHDNQLKQSFKERIMFIINRRNSINGRIYRDDSTIMAWLIIEEPFFNPNYYPKNPGPPTVSLKEVSDWFDEMASYIKSLDSNHLVSIMFTGAISQFSDTQWYSVFDSNFIDFLEFEDNNTRPVTNPEEYVFIVDSSTIKLMALGKPVITMLAPPGPSNPPCLSESFQSNFLRQYSEKNLNQGSAGIVIHLWVPDTMMNKFKPDICRVRTDSMIEFQSAVLEIAAHLNAPGFPIPPLNFIKIAQ
ncbi:MAG: hypothetical protein FJZ98_09775 [Chloroflexi bacterium]|nr:hypothetical protein [Chloroflexota bacterium]